LCKLPGIRAMVTAISERTFAVYRKGDCLTGDAQIARFVADTLTDIKATIDDHTPLVDFLRLRLNNALFRHQALEWASDFARHRGLVFHLWGKGWDKHPTLAHHARGEADNQDDLKYIYHASKVNLQLSPFTTAHQRSFECLSAGGFLIARRTSRDQFDRANQTLFDYGSSIGISNLDHLRLSRDDRLWQLVKEAADAFGQHPLDQPGDFWANLTAQARAQWTEAGSTLWPDEFDQISFQTQADLTRLIERGLAGADWRREMTDKMRQVVIDKTTYVAVTRRLLGFMNLSI